MTTNGDVINGFGDEDEAASFLSYRAFNDGWNAALRFFHVIENDPYDDSSQSWAEWLAMEGTYFIQWVKETNVDVSTAVHVSIEKDTASKGAMILMTDSPRQIPVDPDTIQEILAQ